MPDEISGVIKTQDITGGVTSAEGSISATVESEEGNITATVVSEDQELTGTLTASSASLNATLNNENQSFGTTLTVHYGADGKPGKDGFSPTINVHEETEKTYILRITDVNGSYLTPNLKGSGSIVVGNYVEENLEKYPYVNPITLNAAQRESTFLYAHNSDNDSNRKIKLSDIALETEVADRLRTKIRTVDQRSSDGWRVGDYIFLETGEGE